MSLRVDPLLIVLGLLCIGCTFMGGMIATLPQPLPPGLGSALASALGGQDVPTFSHAVLGLLVGAGCVWMVLSRRVVLLPQTRILAPLLLFIGLIAASVMISRFQAASLTSASEWILYVLSFLFAAGAMGRNKGPLAITGILFGSILYLATLGIHESRTSPDGWRIFALWTPNTQASIQIVGIFLALGLLVSKTGMQRKQEERPTESLRLGFLVPFFAVIGLGLMGFALLLTGSKGGILALGAALGFWITALLLLKFVPRLLPWLGRVTLAAAIVVCLVPGLLSKVPDAAAMKQENKPAASGALSRLSNAASTSEQSVGFRKLLWITGYRVLKENPLGTGMGTFFYHSAQPGLITQTQTAHNTLIELLVEAGPLALVALIAFLFFWIESVMRSSDSEPYGRAAIRFSVTAAAVALLFHAATESNLYTFGLGVIFFVLLAIAAQLSPDSVSPEYVPNPGKVVAAVIATATSAVLLAAGWSEVCKANVKFAFFQHDVEGARASIGTLQSLASNDGETWSLHANLQSSEQERLADLRKAIETGPIPRYFRALAQAQMDQGDFTASQGTLRECFRWDPNNLPAHLLLLKSIDASQHPEDLAKAGQELFDIEKTTYFQIRSIPEIVPTETYAGRGILARNEKDPTKKIQLLEEAVSGYRSYLSNTIPKVKEALASDPSGAFSPEPIDKAKNAMTDARELALLLEQTQTSQGHSAGAKDAEAAGKEFEDALAIFAK